MSLFDIPDEFILVSNERPPAPRVTERDLKSLLRLIADSGLSRAGTKFFRYSLAGVTHPIALKLEELGWLEWQVREDLAGYCAYVTDAGRKAIR